MPSGGRHRGVTVKCPNCGASIDSQHTGFVARCDYCGSQVRVQRRTQFFERVVPPKNLSPELAKLPVAIQKHTRRWVIAIVVFSVFIVVVTTVVPIILVVRKVSKTVTTVTSNSSLSMQRGTPTKQKLRMEGAQPVVIDVNGDGEHDVIARVHRQAKVVFVAAIDGKTGERLWLSDAIGPRSESMSTPMALTPDVVVFSNKNAEVMGIGVADGKTRWKIRMHEQLEVLCHGGDGELLAITADKKQQMLSLADGGISSVTEVRDCHPMTNDIGYRSGGDYMLRDTGEGAPERDAIEGMAVEGAVEWRGGAVNVAFGYKDPGTAIPIIARYEWPKGQRDLPDPENFRRRAQAAADAGDKKESRAQWKKYHKAREALSAREPEILWKVSVPGIDPMKAEPRSNLDRGEIGVDETHVAVAYGVKAKSAHTFRLTAFTAGDGKRVWDIALDGTMPMSGVTVTPTAVFVSRWGSLECFDIKTGKRRFRL